MKVIILTDSKFTKQHYKDLYVKQISSEFDTEIWDISYFINNDKYDDNNEYGIKKLLTPTDFEKELNDLLKNEKAVIVSKPCQGSYKKIYSIIKNYNIKLLCIDKDVSCSYWIYKSKVDFYYMFPIKEVLKALLMLNKYTRYIINVLIKKIPRYDYFFTPHVLYKESSKRYIKMHHIKYDEFLNEPDERLIEGKYALFIDTAAVTHPMYESLFSKEEINTYFYNLRNYFDLFEKTHNIQVVIAGYPKVKNPDKIFGERKIIYNKTSQLIKNAEVILTHYTTSVITGLLARKPLVFLDSKILQKNKGGAINIASMYEFVKQLNTPCDLIENLKVTPSYKIDEKKYDDYINKYVLCSELLNKTNGQIINEFLHKYFNEH